MQTSPDRNPSGNARDDVYTPSDTTVTPKSGAAVKSNDPPTPPAKPSEGESKPETGNRVFKFDFERDPFTFKGNYNVVPGGDNYGFDATGKFGRQKDTTGEFNFKRDEGKDTAELKTDWKFGDRYTFKGNYNVVPGGDNYGFDATGKFGKQKDTTGELNFKRDEGKDTAELKTDWKFGDRYTFKGNYNVVPGGDNYGFDATGKFGKQKDMTGEFNFKRDEGKDTAELKTDWKFGDRYTFKGNYNVVPGGDNYGFDATGKFGKNKDIAGQFSFNRDETKDTAEVKAGLNIRERYQLDANYNLVSGGNNYGFKASAKLGPEQNTKAEVGFKRDELAKTTSGEFSLVTGSGLTAEGKVAKKDGSFTWSAATLIPLEGKGNQLGFGVERNEAERWTKFKGSVLFDEGSSKFGVNSQFGKTEATSIEFSRKTKDYTVTGNVEVGNATGPYKLQKAGLGISTPETSRHRLNLSADYGLQTKDFSAKLTYTFTFGGGSKSRSSRSNDDRFVPSPISSEPLAPVVNLRDKRLHDQAVAGVEKLNASGEKLPVKETAANLVALAKANSFENIASIELGNKTSGGRQNMFIFDGDPNRYSTRQAFIDRDQAATPNIGGANTSPTTPVPKQEMLSIEPTQPTQQLKPLKM